MHRNKHNTSDVEACPSVNIAPAKRLAQSIYKRYTGKKLTQKQAETFAKDFREAFVDWLCTPKSRQEREEGYFYVKCGCDTVLRVRGAWVVEAHRDELGDPYRTFVFIQPLSTFLKYNSERVFDYPYLKNLELSVLRG
jgi:hypothetical protein